MSAGVRKSLRPDQVFGCRIGAKRNQRNGGGDRWSAISPGVALVPAESFACGLRRAVGAQHLLVARSYPP